MKAVLLKDFGGVENMYLDEIAKPQCLENEVLIKVKATALNRADTLQRQGKYPAPKGASNILGLECSGEIIEIGNNVKDFKLGDKVMALLSGGGYAEYVAVDAKLCMNIPQRVTYAEAAAIPEAFLTAFQALFILGELKSKEIVLIHAGASGVGAAAIQLAKAEDAFVFTTASKGKHEHCKKFGADITIDYKVENFKDVILNSDKRIDVLIDFMGASYFQQNINVMNLDGKMIMLGFLGGIKTEDINLRNILSSRIHIKGTTLRSRSLAYRRKLVDDFAIKCLPLFDSNRISPVVDSVLPIEEVKIAHQRMEDNKNIGKIVLTF